MAATPAIGSEPPVGYPDAWVADVVLSDGSTVHLRPIRPDDAAGLEVFHGRQSAESIYSRYFSPRPRLSERDLARLTTVDYVDRMALVAERDRQLIGVARYDRWEHRGEAEVAFFVDDRHHGLGIATMLLEHLAARAREVGIVAFTASVLPQNRSMLGVFTQAGFSAVSRFADGIIEVRLDLRPTPAAEAAIEARAGSAAATAVERLLSPRAVAVVGAGRERGGIGHELFRNLLLAGFEGPVWPVHPSAPHVAGVRAVPSVADIADPVDLVVVAVPAAAVPAVIEECGLKGVRDVVVVSAGFADGGWQGAALEADVVRVARRFGIRLLGPASLGLINTDPAVRLHATFVALDPLPGRFALLSESGMVGASVVESATELALGLSSFVALGNRADVSGNDLLQYWHTDERTSVIGMYIESFGNPRRFARIARDVGRDKPIVAVHAGMGRAGGGMSPDVLLEQTGVISVHTLAELLDVARLLVQQPVPLGDRVAVVGNAGGSLAIAADACVDAGLRLAELCDATRSGLAALTGSDPSGPANPADLGLAADAAAFAAAAGAVGEDPGVDCVLALFAPALGAAAEQVAAALAGAQRDIASGTPGDGEGGETGSGSQVPLAACFLGRTPTDATRRAAGPVPIYRGVDSAALALGRAAAYGRWRDRPAGRIPELDPAVLAALVEVLSSARAAAGGPTTLLSPPERDALFEALGIASVAAREVADLDGAVRAADELGWPVALKVPGGPPAARIAAGVLALDLPDETALRRAWDTMSRRRGAPLRRALVQRMAAPGVEVAVSIERHALMGAVLALGSDRAATVAERAEHVLPVSDLDAVRLVAGCSATSALSAASGANLEAVLVALAALADQVPGLVRVALDLVVRDDAAEVLDAVVEVGETTPEREPTLRRL